MTDFLGNPLAVGDTIAYKTTKPGLKTAIIERVCPKSVWIEVPHRYKKGETMAQNVLNINVVKINAG